MFKPILTSEVKINNEKQKTKPKWNDHLLGF